jgi:hypothetical protein
MIYTVYSRMQARVKLLYSKLWNCQIYNIQYLFWVFLRSLLYEEQGTQIGLVLKINRWSQSQILMMIMMIDRSEVILLSIDVGYKPSNWYNLCSMLNCQANNKFGLRFRWGKRSLKWLAQKLVFRVFSAFKNVTKVLKLRDGTFAGLTKILNPQSF